MVRQLGVLPNAVVRDPRSEMALVMITLADGLDAAALQEWLKKLGAAITDLERPVRRRLVASAVVGLGTRFFNRLPERADFKPWHFGNLPTSQGPVIDADVVLHVTYLSESRKAELITALWATRPQVVSIEVEQGYTRDDGREVFGQRDGLRNLSSAQRRRTTTIRPDELPEEPAWLKDGCYGVYMKIEQNLDAWQALTSADHEATIGRREADGSRLDLPAGTNAHTEPAFADPSTPPMPSHIRKTGPRGPLHDQTLILRRGAPYVEEEGGTVHAGLQFVSYQASLDDFDVVFNRWMMNPDFPSLGAGQDALVARGLITFLRTYFYVVVPANDRFPGAGYFDPAPTPGRPRNARIHIRKRAVDTAGNPTKAEVGDLEFTLIDPQTGGPIGSPVRTNPAGRAVLTGAKVGKQYIIRESPNDRFEPGADETVDISSRNQVVRLTNRLKPAVSPYG